MVEKDEHIVEALGKARIVIKTARSLRSVSH